MVQIRSGFPSLRTSHCGKMVKWSLRAAFVVTCPHLHLPDLVLIVAHRFSNLLASLCRLVLRSQLRRGFSRGPAKRVLATSNRTTRSRDTPKQVGVFPSSCGPKCAQGQCWAPGYVLIKSRNPPRMRGFPSGFSLVLMKQPAEHCKAAFQKSDPLIHGEA